MCVLCGHGGWGVVVVIYFWFAFVVRSLKARREWALLWSPTARGACRKLGADRCRDPLRFVQPGRVAKGRAQAVDVVPDVRVQMTRDKQKSRCKYNGFLGVWCPGEDSNLHDVTR